ncbi:MAG: hypothetical protein AABP62_15365 [Planctomycetota bacterium]
MSLPPGELNPRGQNDLNLILTIREPVPDHYLALKHIVSELKADSMNAIGTVHFGRFFFLNEVSNASGSYFLTLAFIATFDGSFDTYVQQFVNKLSEEFDALLQHLVVPEGVVPVHKNAHAFQAYLESQRVPSAQWYGNYPTLTAVQIRANADAAGA